MLSSISSSKKPRKAWKIRPATLHDQLAANELLKTSYESLLPRDYDSELLDVALPIICVAQEELLTCGTWYVAEDPADGMLVGCGGWTPRAPGKEDGEARPPHLRHFATHPEATRQGVARTIWNQIWEDLCRISSGSGTGLEVYSTITAVPFYRSLGFEEVSRVDISLTPECKFPSVLMSRSSSK